MNWRCSSNHPVPKPPPYNFALNGNDYSLSTRCQLECNQLSMCLRLPIICTVYAKAPTVYLKANVIQGNDLLAWSACYASSQLLTPRIIPMAVNLHAERCSQLYVIIGVLCTLILRHETSIPKSTLCRTVVVLYKCANTVSLQFCCVSNISGLNVMKLLILHMKSNIYLSLQNFETTMTRFETYTYVC